ncbi:hypothetical protein RRG08_046754 [Elysia crispata]|uniref:Uncharacterized protein n=1 Tax=Elysia crispata TaxID=231223 RepID=A0AAE1DMR5_9GAST|nr:hypothetical protein RRG08_046754 [Elysia crispata]
MRALYADAEDGFEVSAHGGLTRRLLPESSSCCSLSFTRRPRNQICSPLLLQYFIVNCFTAALDGLRPLLLRHRPPASSQPVGARLTARYLLLIRVVFGNTAMESGDVW